MKPKNGILSGMIITALAGLAAIVIGLWPGSKTGFFAVAPSPALLNAFLISIILMTIHKIESYFTHEYDVCPVYITSGRASWAQNNRQAIFLSFVPTFILLAFANYLSMKGPPWPMLLIMVWLGQGLHEYHHLAKTCAQKKYYSGAISAIFFIAQIDFFVYPLWCDVLSIEMRYFYFIAQPIVFLGFYFEHRIWMRKN